MTTKPKLFNKNLVMMIICQGLFLTNNVTFAAINGLVGFSLTPIPWLATLPLMGYVVGGALSTSLVAETQRRYGRKKSFQFGIIVAVLSALLCALAVSLHSFALLITGTVVAGYYNANGQIYRFAAPELTHPSMREKAVSWVLAGGLIGGVFGPGMTILTKDALSVPFMGPYLALSVIGVVAYLLMHQIHFPDDSRTEAPKKSGRPLAEIIRQPLFIVSALGASMGYGIMNLLMAATPLAMDVCGFPFSDAALVLQWHVIGMFAPGFFTGSLIKKFGAIKIMTVGLGLNLLCIAIALSGVELHHFLAALFMLGVGWNFLFIGSTTLVLNAYKPEEKDKAQGAINFCVFAVMAVTSISSGALLTTKGWDWMNYGSLIPVALIGLGLVWLISQSRSNTKSV